MRLIIKIAKVTFFRILKYLSPDFISSGETLANITPKIRPENTINGIRYSNIEISVEKGLNILCFNQDHGSWKTMHGVRKEISLWQL